MPEITQVGLVGRFGLSDNEIRKQILQILINNYGVSAGGGAASTSPSLPQAASMEFGGSANVYLTDAGTSNTGTVYAIEALTDTVIGTLTAATGYTTTGIPTNTLPAGTVLYGRYSVVTITTGNVIAYKV